MKMTRYDEREADYIDKLIRSALCAAAERLIISKEKKYELLNRIKKQKNKNG